MPVLSSPRSSPTGILFTPWIPEATSPDPSREPRVPRKLDTPFVFLNWNPYTHAHVCVPVHVHARRRRYAKASCHHHRYSPSPLPPPAAASPSATPVFSQPSTTSSSSSPPPTTLLLYRRSPRDFSLTLFLSFHRRLPPLVLSASSTFSSSSSRTSLLFFSVLCVLQARFRQSVHTRANVSVRVCT